MNIPKPQLLLSLKSYSKEKFVKDLIAGVIVAIIALPLSIALAIASGVSPEQGLYTAIVAGFLISALGGSRVQIAGPTAAFATIVAGIVALHGMDGLILATVMAGILLILMGVLRLGNMIKYVPYPITVGFTAGIAVTILIGQVKDFLGLTFGSSPVETVDKLGEIVKSIGTLNVWALAIGCLALAILIVWPKFFKQIPASLIAVIVTAAVVRLAKLPVNTIGDLYTISGALPSFHFPSLSLSAVTAVLPNAFTIAILAAIESLLSCVVADEMIGAKHDSNMELIAQGVGNTASALFGGIPATGAIARTAANIKNGGSSPIAGMVHALVLLAILVFLMPYAALIPMPCIAAILFQVAYNMSGWRSVVKTGRRAPISDTAVLVVTFALTVIFDLVVAIVAGLVLALVLLAIRMARTAADKRKAASAPLSKDGGEPSLPDCVTVHALSGHLFFGTADRIPHATAEEGKKLFVLQMDKVASLDYTAMNAFFRLQKECRQNNVKLVLVHVGEQPLKVIRKSGLLAELGEDCLLPDLTAVQASCQA